MVSCNGCLSLIPQLAGNNLKFWPVLNCPFFFGDRLADTLSSYGMLCLPCSPPFQATFVNRVMENKTYIAGVPGFHADSSSRCWIICSGAAVRNFLEANTVTCPSKHLPYSLGFFLKDDYLRSLYRFQRA